MLMQMINGQGLGFPGSSDNKEPAHNPEDTIQFLGTRRSPEKGMATHSSILAWEIPWKEEPGGLQSMGSQKNQAQLSN